MLFEHKGDEGLTDLLNGNCEDVSDVLYRCEDVPNLTVIFAGKFDKNTPELLSSRRMADTCFEMSKRYKDRIVIIDSPPVLACAEPANIAMHVHQVILVVAAAQTTRSQVRAALENVSACRSVSVLFNKAPQWHRVDGESYYYYGNDRAAAQ
jgi:receptor protein-tyrosine kinase